VKPGDRYTGRRGEIEIETEPFWVDSGATYPIRVEQVRGGFLTGVRAGEKFQWGVGYIEADFVKVEK
jgi:hypothetical protein